MTRPHSSTSRSLLLMSVSNGVYILGGWALTVALARVLGPAGFGHYGVVAGVITVINMLVTRALPVAATRAIAEHPGQARAVMATTARMLAVQVIVTTGLFAVMSPLIAILLGRSQLQSALMIGSVAAVSFAVNALLLAYVNGMRLFRRQAFSQGLYGIARAGTITAGAAVAGLQGAIVGFVVAPLVGALPLISRIPRDTGDTPQIDPRQMIVGSVPLVVTAMSVMLLMVVDLFAFTRVAPGTLVGVYAAAGALAHVPYFLLQAAAQVLLPNVASADPEHVPGVVRHGVSDIVVLLALPTALLVAIGDPALHHIFGARYGSDVLIVAPLALATAGVTLHATFVGIDSALHRLRVALALGFAAVVTLGGAVEIAGRSSGLTGAGWAAAAVCGTLALAHTLVEHSRFGWVFEWRALAGIALASALSGAARLMAPDTGLGIAIAIAAVSTVYCATALGSGLFRLRGGAR